MSRKKQCSSCLYYIKNNVTADRISDGWCELKDQERDNIDKVCQSYCKQVERK
jgi:hypothetical protein